MQSLLLTEIKSESESFNIAQMAERCGVTEGTIRAYQRDFEIPSWKLTTGERHFSADLVPLFKQIRAMKQQGLAASEIGLNISEALIAERDRLRTVPEASGIDMITVVNEAVKRIRSEIQDHDQLVVQRVLEAVGRDYGQAMEQVGAYKAQTQFLAGRLAEVEQQSKLLPAQAESLRDAQERTRWAEEEARRAQEQQTAANEALEGTKDRIKELELAQQGLQAQLTQAQLERKQAEQQASDLRLQLEQAQANNLAQADELNQAQAQIGTLKRELETERLALAAEQRKTWLDKLTKK